MSGDEEAHIAMYSDESELFLIHYIMLGIL